ncbi:MAG: hypothetical protein ACXVPR_05410 [Actinomycetota bacterium]
MQSTLERVVRHRVAVVLTLAGVADVATGDPAAHGIALVAVAALVAVEQVRERYVDERALAGRRAVFRVSTPLAIGAVLYAAIIGTFARWSWPISIAVAVPGALAVAYVWLGTPAIAANGPRAEPRPSAVPWVIVLLALAAWEVQALLLQPSLTTSSWSHPTLSTLMDPVLASHIGRSISLAVWLWFGGYLLER